MAVDKKISQLTSLAQVDVSASTDVLPIVDTSATETKKITVSALVGAGATAGISGAVLTNGTINSTTIGATTASTGAFTTLTTSSTVTLNGGTANGVLYLNGSKVATSGSALTFDGSTFGTTGNIQLENNKYIAFKTNGGAAFYSYYTNTSNNLFINGYNETLFLLNNSEGMRLTSTGLGIGTTSPTYKLDVSVTTNNGIRTTSSAGQQSYLGNTGGEAVTGTLNNYGFGIITNGSIRGYFDTSGNLGIGVTPTVNLDVKNAGGNCIISAQYGTGTKGQLIAASNEVILKAFNGTNDVLTFYTGASERARITAGGYFKASNDGTYQGSTGAYHELKTNAADYSTVVGNTNASPYGAYILFGNADPNNTTNLFLLCNGWNGTANTTRATIRSNGGLANYQANDVNLSDQRVKKDIKPLGSMWDKFKALEIVTFKYKDQTHDDDNIGVIAQQVESVAPEFIDTDGFGNTPEGEEPLKTVYTTDMYHAAIKALQEAMARIEQLEAKVAVLESK